MKTLKLILISITAMYILTGCTIMEIPYEETTSQSEYEEYDNYYVDAYVSIPYEVKKLIAGSVDGYSMPPVSRYGIALYPVVNHSDPYNLPSYVKSDFNGDGYYDYAYMFSYLTWSNSDWFLKTKMIIVASTSYGFTIASEIILGSVSGSQRMPVEEYWGIRLLKKGTHMVSVSDGRGVDESEVQLYNDAIYLASVDPEERSIFYLSGTEANEIILDMGAIAKRKVTTNEERASRVIKLNDN
jgi:hypothetical protein